MTREEAQERVQLLAVEATAALKEIAMLSEEFKFEGAQVLDLTYHRTRAQYGHTYDLYDPDWYDNEYWKSSTAHCDLGIKIPGEDDY